MTGRERVLAALTGGRIDRLAVDIGATDFTGVSAEAYGPLKSALGVAGGNTRVVDPLCGRVRVERAFREKIGVDAAGLFVGPRRWRPGTLAGGVPCLFPERWEPREEADGSQLVRHEVAEFALRRRAGSPRFSLESPPLSECRTRTDVSKRLQAIAFFDWPYLADEIAAECGVRARAMRQETDAALVFNTRVRVLGGALELRGKAFLRDLAEEPKLASALLGRLVDAYIARLTDFLPEVSPHVDVVCVMEGPAHGISLDDYRRHIKPHHERLYAHIRKTSGLPLAVQVHGMASDLVCEMAGLGVEAVSFSAWEDTARPSEVRKALGGGVAIWGVGAAADFLASADAGSARSEVRRLVEAAGGPERLVFGFGKMLPAGTRSEALLAALEEARSIRP